MSRTHSNRKTALLGSLAAATLGVLLVGCAPGASTSTGAGSSDTPVVGGTLTYLDPVAPTCFYAGGSGQYSVGGVLNSLTDKLTYQNPDTLEIEPWLAESWEINDTATEFTFHLKDGVTFSDDTVLDATVVAKNFDAYGLGSEELGLAIQEQINNYASSEVIDPLTVKFTFSQPSPGFLQATSVIGSGIVALSTIELPYEEQCQLENQVGSGPFTVSNQVIDQEIDLVAREDYAWAPASSENQGRPYLDEIKVLVTAEDSVRIGALTSGQADYVRTVQAFDETTVTAAGYSIYAPAARGVNRGLYFRPTNSILSDITVRKALMAGTDAKSLVETVLSPSYAQATSILSATAPGYVDLSDKLVYDVDLANELLDDAGWVAGSNGFRSKDGVPLEFTVHVSPNYSLSQQVQEFIAQQWTDIGVKLNIRTVDAATATIERKDPELIGIIENTLGRADQDVLKSQFSQSNRNNLLSGDDVLDGLLVDVASTADADARNAEAAAVQEYLLDNAYGIPLFEQPEVFGAAEYVEGIAFEAVGRPSFYNVWLNK